MGRKLSRSLAAYGAVFDSLLPSDERRRKFQTANGGAKGRLVFAEREREEGVRGGRRKRSQVTICCTCVGRGDRLLSNVHMSNCWIVRLEFPNQMAQVQL